jgi:PAS domain S-box-containing protein
MDGSENRRTHWRAVSFGALAVVLSIAAGVVARQKWAGNAGFHTGQEIVATTLALMAGTLALLRYYAKKTSTFLLLGSGFLGAGLLDGYHIAITSLLVAGRAPSQLRVVAAWSEVASRIFVSILIWASCLWRRHHATGDAARRREIAIYSLVSVWTVFTFLLFTLAPLPQPTYPEFPIHRPADLFAGLLFLGAAIGYLRHGAWKSHQFEYWLILSLITSAVAQGAFGSLSMEMFDAPNVVAHCLEIGAYLFVLTGLLISTHNVFRREANYALHLEEANRSLEAEIEERLCAEESLRQAHAHMEQLVEERTEDLAAANRELEEEIGERRWAEEALCLSEERFRIAAENASDAIWEVDMTDHVHYFRPQGAGPDPLPFASSLADLVGSVHPDDRERVVTAMQRTRDLGEPFRQEYRVIARNGEIVYRSTRGSAVRDSQGRVCRCIGVSSDITQRKQEEAALCHLAAIVESSEAAIISKALDGTVLTWNAAAERIFGYTLAEVKFRRSAIVPEDRLHEDAGLLQKVSAGECVHMETVRIRKDGAPISVAQTVSPIRDSAGNITGGSWVVSDITERKALERQLAQAQKLESIGQLAAGIAHEINTPIQYVGDNMRFLRNSFSSADNLFQSLERLVPAMRECGTACRFANHIDTLVHDADFEYLRDEMPKCVDQSLEGVEHIAKIVRAMRDFSHPGPLEKVASDLNRAIESTIQVSRNEWKYVADVTADLDPNLPLVECVTGEVNQVVLNLIVNAAHAIADVAKDKPERRGKITVSTRKEGDWAEIRVADTGSGIPEGIRGRVFDPFFTTKPVGKGTGQGLSIAHSVVVGKHGGAIRFETETGVGTTFVVRLPLREAA